MDRVGSGSSQTSPTDGQHRCSACSSAWAGFAASVLALSEVSLAFDDLLVSVGLAVLLILLFGFPAEIFNSTVEEHYDELVGPFRCWQRPPPQPAATLASIAASPGGGPGGESRSKVVAPPRRLT